MNKSVQFSIFITVLLISTVVSVLLLERSTMFLTKRNFGLSTWFAVNGHSLLLAACVCILMFICMRTLYRSILPEEKFLEYIAGVSIYLNGISLVIIFIMLIHPTVRLDGISPFYILYKILTNPCDGSGDFIISFNDWIYMVGRLK